jgi:anti-sigma regulatory factor (Ser/Thr protein kinase)/biotin operon repressor
MVDNTVDNIYTGAMHPRDRIVKFLAGKQSANAAELANLIGFSRQALNKHIRELVQGGKVLKHGRTRGAYYSLTGTAGDAEPVSGRPGLLQTFKRRYLIDGLEEHVVFEQIALFQNLRKQLNKNAYAIIEYAFTEILNNAVEHSGSGMVDIGLAIDAKNLRCTIRDYGIGVFESIRHKFKLPDEPAAVGELIKGKTTTMPERHTGEGLFFTSRSVDTVTLRSHRIGLTFDNLQKDVFLNENRFTKGTLAGFEISTQSKRRLEAIFREYAPEEFNYKFERTRVHVKLFAQEYVSRSEAKRLLFGLDKFSGIVLDFKGVRSIGQGFADEIFRVFAKSHPHITLKPENLSPALRPMISHVVDNKSLL